MKKNRTTITFIISLIIAVLVLGVFFFFFTIVKNKNKHTSVVLTTLENKIVKKRNASVITQKIEEVNRTASLINSYFADPNQIDSFVSYLEEIGTSADTTVKVETVEIASQVKNTLSVTVSLEGNFSNVIRTVKLLENAPYKIHIGRMALDKRSKTTTTLDVKGAPTSREVTVWHAEISFTILSSS